MEKIIIASILFLISVLAFIMSIRSFKGKGFLFNNAYLYASEQERENMDKRPYYRQSAIVFLLLGFVFLLNGLASLFDMDWLFYVVVAVIVITLIYAIASSVAIEKRNK